MAKAKTEDEMVWTDKLANAAFLGVMAVARLLPYRRRIPVVGWFFSRLLGPIAGWSRRARENLTLAMPELSPSERARIAREVLDNAGRSMAEIYSGEEFTARIRDTDRLTGPGLAALEEAAASDRPVILACAHFGNYDAMRAALSARGWPVGALYRPMNNPAFNAHYIPAMRAIAEPIFPRGRSGFAAMLKFLRGGGMLALGFDQFVHDGTKLDFFGLPSRTVLTPAELTLRYDALLVPINGIRQPDGLSFSVEVGQPIAHTTPEEMMQALNADLERQIRARPGQWFWVHRRWKKRDR
ncbi:MAG TPA: lysophospholipid acyltransferase family protein [Paracoccus sp. (in: a-proteobacteria)]|uniref:lysophospholipid acyltransferase family protein n=1 Tax=uncultured Paracoccus sp. TaxID=189685 RepID=UPI002607EEE7|nr:lysophospholipid acyltransferase family protein [uncultured Paracoccus sp.]HMQ41210.1 lysophospholipid acyltransferase family protein [Paracoccus sp. (in: a-proteobacteria)]HMR35421.1 lysophospholipid acyltransferase family protein [Paracoccus sp. (in: a-proteobacteria)]